MENGRKNFLHNLKFFFNKENFSLIKERVNFIHIIVFFLLFIGSLNIFLNHNTFQAEIESLEVNEVFSSSVPDESISILGSSIKIDSPVGFQYMFSIFDLSEIDQDKSKTIFRDGIKRYLSVYEIKGGLDTYLKVKNTVEYYIENVAKKGSIFESNNLGVYSFYYNDEKKGIVYRVALIGGQVFGFEYNIEIKDEIDIFTKNIAKNIF